MPVLLSAIGPRLNWPRRTPAVTRSRLFAAIATGVLRRRRLAVLGSVAVLLALAAALVGVLGATSWTLPRWLARGLLLPAPAASRGVRPDPSPPAAAASDPESDVMEPAA